MAHSRLGGSPSATIHACAASNSWIRPAVSRRFCISLMSGAVQPISRSADDRIAEWRTADQMLSDANRASDLEQQVQASFGMLQLERTLTIEPAKEQVPDVGRQRDALHPHVVHHRQELVLPASKQGQLWTQSF